MNATGRCCRWAALAVTATVCGGLLVPCRASDSGPLRSAFLIGIEKYRLAPPLEYTINDVEQLAETLRDRGGYQTRMLTERKTDEQEQPWRKSIMARLPEWLELRRGGEQILVYFSGHGFRDTQGRLYLAPLDADPQKPEETCISADWLRSQLERCRADFKLLVLDACHAGSEKGGDETSVPSKDLASAIGEVPGVVTLASCTGKEKSLIWEEKKQSLFSYWLNQGLRGHADAAGDGNGRIDIDELYKYLYQQVPAVAQSRFHRAQTPARIIGPRTVGVETVMEPAPSTLKGLLNDIAESLATAMQLRKIPAMGVPEFAVDAKQAELALRLDFGSLGRYCASELEGRLVFKSASCFDVLQHEAIQKALQTKGWGVSEAHRQPVKDLAVGDRAVAAMALGTLRSRRGREVTLQCVLRSGESTLGWAGGAALLNESEWGMLGKSAALRPEDRKPAPRSEVVVRPVSAALVDRLDRRSKDPHPLLDPGFPYRLKIMVAGQERAGVFREQSRELFVPIAPGEVYEIWLENRTSDPVFLRLLVDGLNTLPDYATTFVDKGVVKAVIVEGTNQGELRQAQRVNLAEARAWLVDPMATNAVRGFYSATGTAGAFNQFVLVDASQSAAGQQQFTSQLGIITAAFYAPRKPTPLSRSLSRNRGLGGTGLGQLYREATAEYGDGQIPGDLLAVLQIRYCNPAEMPQE